MRFASVSFWYPDASADTYEQPVVTGTLLELTRQGHSVDLVTAHVPRAPTPRPWGHVPLYGRSLSAGSDRWAKVRGLWRTADGLARRRDARPDVVVAINSDALPVARVLAWRCRARLALLHLGGIDLAMLVRERRPGQVVRSFAGLLGPLDAAIVVADGCETGVLRLVRRFTPRSRLLVLTPPYGPLTAIHESRAAVRSRLGLPTGVPIIGWAGRVDPLKAPEWFVDLARSLASPPAVLACMAGASADQIASRCGPLPANVRVLGRLSRADLHAWLTAIDLYVAASPLTAMTTVTREAFALGCPVAAIAPAHDPWLDDLAAGEAICLRFRPEARRLAACEVARALAEPDGLQPMVDRARRALGLRGVELGHFAARAGGLLADLVGACVRP